MPELSRRQIGQLVFLLLVIANAGLFGWDQFQRRQIVEQKLRLSALENQSVALLRGRNDPNTLKQDIAETEQKIQVVSLAFPSKTDTVALQDHIVQVARLNQVQISSLSMQPPSTRTLAGGIYPVVILSVLGRGDLHNLYGFLGQAQKNLYNTSSVENVSATLGDQGWSMKFDVAVYTRP